MRKWHLIILFTIFFFQISYANEEQKNIEFIHGVAVQNGKALYVNFEKMEGIAVIAASETSIKNSESAILTNSIIIPIEGNILYVYDSKRDEPYFELLNTEREYFYKIANNQLLISKDRNNWEMVKVKVISINDEKSIEDKEGPVFMTIYLESKYFKGEYDLIGTPDSEPFP